MRPGEKVPSKAALKNQKKREAKKAARQVSCCQPIRRLLQLSVRTKVWCVCVQDSKPEAPSGPPPVCQSQSELSAGDPETDKKIKNIKKVKTV